MKKPLPVLAYSLQDAQKIIFLGKTGRRLASKFWPGGLTIVAPLVDQRISAKVTAGSRSLAVRVPANHCVLSLLRRCRYLVGTSANISGQKSVRSAREIIDSPLCVFDALLHGGDVEKGIESTIIDVTDDDAQPRVLREGAIKSTELYELLSE